MQIAFDSFTFCLVFVFLHFSVLFITYILEPVHLAAGSKFIGTIEKSIFEFCKFACRVYVMATMTEMYGKTDSAGWWKSLIGQRNVGHLSTRTWIILWIMCYCTHSRTQCLFRSIKTDCIDYFEWYVASFCGKTQASIGKRFISTGYRGQDGKLFLYILAYWHVYNKFNYLIFFNVWSVTLGGFSYGYNFCFWQNFLLLFFFSFSF